MYARTITTTDGFEAIAGKRTVLRLVTITAIGGDVQIRRAGTETNGTIPDGSSLPLIGVNLADVELDIPADASASIVGSA